MSFNGRQRKKKQKHLYATRVRVGHLKWGANKEKELWKNGRAWPNSNYNNENAFLMFNAMMLL